MKRILNLIIFTIMLVSLTSCSIVSSIVDLIKPDVAYTRCDKDGKSQEDGEYLLFGEYPQTLKNDSVTVTETVDERGYYLGDDGAYYAKVVANPYSEEYTFAGGASISSGEVYYFKVEPIRWRILSVTDGVAVILCDSIIENKAYDADKDNNYKNSDIRTWLNGTFYETAFAEIQRDIIVSAAVEGAEDKIYLLSSSDLNNTDFGFNASLSEYDSARRLQTTDFARANGAWMKTAAENYGNGSWWLCSSIEGTTNKAYRIDSAGGVDEGYVNHAHYGVAAALSIKL